jgi:hypothetical protein
MKSEIKIGKQVFPTKKEALNHFKMILNSYDIGDFLNEGDLKDVLSLLEMHPEIKEMIGVGISNVRVSRAQYNTKSFELVRIDGSTEFFSYTKRINAPKTDFAKFSEACRKSIQKDLRNVKLSYFEKFSKKGKVKCQETGKYAIYEELTVDHRQPNTFSVIVDRFIELNGINLKNIKYIEVDGETNELEDKVLEEKFKQYHKEKANLRIIMKDLNLGRSFQARVSRQKKDLIIKDEKNAT